MTIIVCIILLILCAFVLGIIFAPDDMPRLFIGVWLAWVVVCLGAFVGIVYVAVHFATKYW